MNNINDNMCDKCKNKNVCKYKIECDGIKDKVGTLSNVLNLYIECKYLRSEN